MAAGRRAPGRGRRPWPARAPLPGNLTVLAAGPDEARALLEPLFGAVGRQTLWVGEPGSASRLKLVLNNWVLAVTAGTAESLALAEGLDVGPGLFLAAVSGGPLDSPYLHAKAAGIRKEDFACLGAARQ